jgi:hypothetical protein
MPRLPNNWRKVWAAAAMLALAGCNPTPADKADTPKAAKPTLGLMTSLPLYWGEGAGIADLAAGRAALPWQRQALEVHNALVPLDTLSPIPALSPDAPEVDPLAGMTRLAVIQPRGFSPADNAALDAWIRNGGRLLLVLDPVLTGDYDIPLGDPRRPVDTALIPPVVERWGLAVSYDEAQAAGVTTAKLAGAALPLALAGRIAIVDPSAARCTTAAGGAAAICRVGKGRVTLIADAALFEHPELAGEDGAGLVAVIAAALE